MVLFRMQPKCNLMLECRGTLQLCFKKEQQCSCFCSFSMLGCYQTPQSLETTKHFYLMILLVWGHYFCPFPFPPHLLSIHVCLSFLISTISEMLRTEFNLCSQCSYSFVCKSLICENVNNVYDLNPETCASHCHHNQVLPLIMTQQSRDLETMLTSLLNGQEVSIFKKFPAYTCLLFSYPLNVSF